MRSIFIVIGFLILSGCQSVSEKEDSIPNFGKGSVFPYQGKKYILAHAWQDNNHVIKIMPEDQGFFPASEASKKEAENVSYNIIRFNICRNGEVKLLNIIEVDRVFGTQQSQLTRYVATFKCQFD